MDTDRIPEQIARTVDHKWSPVRHHVRDFRRSGVQADGQNFRVYARVYTRDHYLYGYSSADEVPELDAVFVLSLVSPDEAGDIYDQVSVEIVSQGEVLLGDIVIGPTWSSISSGVAGTH